MHAQHNAPQPGIDIPGNKTAGAKLRPFAFSSPLSQKIVRLCRRFFAAQAA
jgi:hypothetical protein